MEMKRGSQDFVLKVRNRQVQTTCNATLTQSKENRLRYLHQFSDPAESCQPERSPRHRRYHQSTSQPRSRWSLNSRARRSWAGSIRWSRPCWRNFIRVRSGKAAYHVDSRASRLVSMADAHLRQANWAASPSSVAVKTTQVHRTSLLWPRPS